MKASLKFTGKKTRTVQRLIVSMLDILKAIGIPTEGTDRSLEKMAMACLALGGIKKNLAEAQSANDGRFLTTRQIIVFENDNYGENISSGSYDGIRRKDLLLPVEAGIVIRSANLESQAVNNPTRGYALAPHFAKLLRNYDTTDWIPALEEFNENAVKLIEELQRKRELERVPVTLPTGEELKLSAGEHNVLQKAIIEDFLPRFSMGAELLYVGDTEDKFLYIQEDKLSSIGFFRLEHEELPDIVAYSAEKDLLFLIEAVHSAGPMSEIRVRRLKRQLENCKATLVFITAFESKPMFRRWVVDIAWETEVWIADNPDHLVHFNGYKFLEIHK